MLNVLDLFDFGSVVKEDDRYTVKDCTTLKDLVISSTLLKPGKETSGHSHDDQDEVYIFLKGVGEMIIDNNHNVVYGSDGINDADRVAYENPEYDVVLVPAGSFHKVKNIGGSDLYFVCVFNGKRLK